MILKNEAIDMKRSEKLYEKATELLQRANELAENGKREKAEKLYERGSVYLANANELAEKGK